MQPKTSVRQPVIAGARRQHLSELLRQWRRQPRKRSPLLFWTLLSLALLSDCSLLFLTAQFLSVRDSIHWEWQNWENWLLDFTPARLALYSSLPAVFFFAAAGVVRLRWPLWRRRLLLAGLLSGLGCLSWQATFLGQSLRDAVLPNCGGSEAMLWLASVILGLGLFLALLFRDAFLALVVALASSIGFLAANFRSQVFAGPWLTLPHTTDDDIYLRIQVLILLSAFAALVLAWSIAVLTLVRILLDGPSSERLRRLATLALWPIRLGFLLLAASALLDGWRALERGFAWHGGSAQVLCTLLLLPGCAALVDAQRRGGMPPFRLLVSVVLGSTFLAVVWHTAVLWGNGDLHSASALSGYVAGYGFGLPSLSLAFHAALRYYFGKQRILEV